MCLMPACVSEEADMVVGVVVPEDAAEIAAGAIVLCVLVVRLNHQSSDQIRVRDEFHVESS